MPPSLRPKGVRRETGTRQTRGRYARLLSLCYPATCLPCFSTHTVYKLVAASFCPLKLTTTLATFTAQATWQLLTAAGPQASHVIKMGCWSLNSTSTFASRLMTSGLSRWVLKSPSATLQAAGRRLQLPIEQRVRTLLCGEDPWVG